MTGMCMCFFKKSNKKCYFIGERKRKKEKREKDKVVGP